MPRLLYIHQYFKTPEQGGALRSWYLATGLAERGWQVEIITTHNEAKTETVIYQPNLIVYYLPVAYSNHFSQNHRIAAFGKYLLRLFPYLKGRFDLCIATSTPLTVALPALWLKKKYGIPFVFEVRDLWPQAPIELGFIKNKVAQKLLYRFEKYVYRQAEAVIALSPGMQAGVLKSSSDTKTYLLPNISDNSYFDDKPADSQWLRQKWEITNDQQVVAYTGTLGEANAPDHLLDMARQLYELDVVLLICGEGKKLPWLRRQVEAEQLQNVRFTGHINREQIREVLHLSDLCCVLFGPQPVLQTNSPNKFFDALAASRPVLVNTAGWLKELVEKHDCGLYLPQNNVQKLAHYLNQLKEDRRAGQVRQNARRLAQQFGLAKAQESIDKILKSCLKK